MAVHTTSSQSKRIVEVGEVARGQKQNDDLLMDDELAAAFLGDDSADTPVGANDDSSAVADDAQALEDDTNDMPGQLALDVYETKEKLVVKARTAGVNKQDLEVSISEGILTITGTLASGEEEVEQWHLQECYWGEFSRTLALPVPVKEEDIEATLKDGVLTISFTKVKQEQARKIEIL